MALRRDGVDRDERHCEQFADTRDVLGAGGCLIAVSSRSVTIGAYSEQVVSPKASVD
jgi:hypothetical protein